MSYLRHGEAASFGCAGCRSCACRPLGEPGLGARPRAGTPAARHRARVGFVKGKLAERLMTRTRGAVAALAEARRVAGREGIDPRTVKFTRAVKGLHHDGVERQLTDGMIYGVDRKGAARIFNVFESKARSSLRDVAVRRQGDLGQIARDFERLRELPVRIDGKVFQPSRVKVGRRDTSWTVFGPRDVGPEPADQRELARSGFSVRFQPLQLTNRQLEQRAGEFVRRHGVPPRRRR